MAPKTADELFAELDVLGSESQPTRSAKTTAKPAAPQAKVEDEENDFGEIEKLLAAKKPVTNSRPTTPATLVRPTTPRVSSSTTTSVAGKPAYTPASSSLPSSQRTSEEERRNQQEAPMEQKQTAGGGWWGSMFSAASAAVKQAGNVAKDIRVNETWAEQVRGYGANLSSLSTDLRSKAMPTFTALVSHLAPPISAHERLQIHITHDIAHYPPLDPLIYYAFQRTMAQVEGGDLLVIQRGSEGRASQDGYRGGVLGSTSSPWTEGPWWRDDSARRDLGTIRGLKVGTRLARVSAESYAKEFFDSRGGVEEAAMQATQVLNESNPIRSSDIFLAIQAVAYESQAELFADDVRQVIKDNESDGADIQDPTAEEVEEEEVAFAIHLHDPIHSLSFSALSQPFPAKWATWLDAAPSPSSPTGVVGSSAVGSEEAGLPDSIVEIIQAGGVDPREWVSAWMEEILSLGVGVVAQRYVARRMGVGEGGIGRGKRRSGVEEMSGEAARAL